MRKVIRDSILAIIDKVISSVQDRDSEELKRLSNYTIHSASIFQDEDSMGMAIIIYTISKILSNQKEIIDETSLKSICINLDKMKQSLIKENDTMFRQKFSNIYKTLAMLDGNTKKYVDEVWQRSKIKKGTVMFEHGISLAQVATTLNVSKWDLMEYVGHTDTFDKEKAKTIKVKERLNFVRNLFGVS